MGEFTKGGILSANQLEDINSNLKWKKGGVLSATQLNKLCGNNSSTTAPPVVAFFVYDYAEGLSWYINTYGNGANFGQMVAAAKAGIPVIGIDSNTYVPLTFSIGPIDGQEGDFAIFSGQTEEYFNAWNNKYYVTTITCYGRETNDSESFIDVTNEEITHTEQE